MLPVSDTGVTGGTSPGRYDLLPTYPLAPNLIQSGFGALADVIGHVLTQGRRYLAIDGYGGVLWEDLRAQLAPALAARGIEVAWVATSDALLREQTILSQIAPYLGGDDPLFGSRIPGQLHQLFRDGLRREPHDAFAASNTPILCYGVGAALFGRPDFLIYVDVPKDEIQRRMKAGLIANLGATTPTTAQEMYKRFYFVDWPLLNRHKRSLARQVDLVVDAQNPETPTFLAGDELRRGLSMMTARCFRPRPWFAPGPWGGQWMKRRFSGLPAEAPNYAWSFELIAPENGLVFESSGAPLEVSFDWLMFHDHQAVLGRAAERFEYDFPIRFDYLDTVDGGNLSIQCHPRPDYIREHFGEPFTQDETYYIVDRTAGTRVYLGFRDDADTNEFRQAVQTAARDGQEVDVDRFVYSVPSRPHDLLLIPHGTVHSSGGGNLVLEISATPYIFTFKIYDWLRRDLDGNLRPLNIERAWENLDLKRTGRYVRDHLISCPSIIDGGTNWQLVHLPTHPDHFYDVHRFEFHTSVDVLLEERCHVLNLVEGRSVILQTANGHRRRVNFAETVVVPAGAGSYRLTNEGEGMCRMVKAFVR